MVIVNFHLPRGRNSSFRVFAKSTTQMQAVIAMNLLPNKRGIYPYLSKDTETSPWGVVHKVLYGDWWRLRSEVQSLTFQYTIFERKSTPFLYFLFRIPSLRPGILLTAVTDAYQWLRTSLNLKRRLRQLRNGLFSSKEGHRILSTVIS